MAALNIVSFVSVSLLFSFSVTSVQSWAPKLPSLPKFKPIVLKKPAPPAPEPPTTQPPPFVPVTDSKYCEESDLTKIFTDSGKSKRGAAWPFECKYPSIVKQNGKYEFMYAIYTCCNKCSSPSFGDCTVIHGTPDWRCPSDGIHCIMDCVEKHGPAKPELAVHHGWPGVSQIGDGIGTWGKPKPVPEQKEQVCEKEEVRADGTKCIRRLCIPLKV